MQQNENEEKESLNEKQVGFDSGNEEEENAQDDQSNIGIQNKNQYQLKIAVSQKHYPSNKKNSSLYTGWTFIPINLYHQLLNPVFQFYLIIMIFEVIPPVSMTNGIPNTILPYSIVILIQMIADYFIYFKVNELDGIQNNMEVRKVNLRLKYLKMENSN
jgi:phospholipid-transporting ATPase